MTEQTFKKPERIIVDALSYLSEILKNGIIKDLQDNQILCKKCNGTGLTITDNPYGLKGDPDRNEMFPYKKQMIVGCRHCYTGVIDLCEHCKSELPRSISRCECDKAKSIRHSEKLAKEKALWDKAIKLKISDKIAGEMGMYYFEGYPYNEGYFSYFDEFVEWWEENYNDEEKPLYVWGTYTINLSLDADSILENATDDLHEEADNNIVYRAELQQFLDDWCAKQSGTTTYYQDTKYAIEIPWTDGENK